MNESGGGKSIDDKVISFGFDNTQFEQNVAQSLGTLDKLKKALKLDGVAKGFEEIDNSTKKMDFSGMQQGIEAVQTKFSYLQMTIQHQINNIVDTAVNAGKNIVSALTIDPIKTGLSEYETKINAIQVIKANTRGKNSMEDITKALDELNTYADNTIYNFAQMTDNIGKFTAQGLDVEKAAKAVQGMANLAGASGASAMDMSRATYQMSQALGGVIRKMDWNSLRNANMASETLKNTLIDVAKIEENIDVKAMMEKEGKTFEDTLEKGWLTGDLFTEAMNMYSDVYSEAELKAKGFSKDQIANFKDLAAMAQSATVEVKTFTQLWDVLKETAQSGWTQSWESIIGDFDTAKKDLTELQIYFSDLINASANARNEVIDGWAEGGGRTKAIDALKDAWFGLLNIVTPIKDAFKEVFPPLQSKDLLNFTERIKDLAHSFRELTAAHSEDIGKVFKTLFTTIKGGINIVKSFVSAITPFVKVLGKDLISVALKIGNVVISALDKLNGAFQNGSDGIENFGKKLSKNIDTSGFKKLGNSIENIKSRFSGFFDFLSQIGEKIGETISGIFSMDNVADTITFVVNAFSGLLNVIASIGDAVKKVLGPMITGLYDYLNELSLIETISNVLKGGGIAAVIKSIGGAIKDVLFGDKDAKSANVFVETLNSIKSFFGDLSKIPKKISETLGSVGEALEMWQTSIKTDIIRSIAISIGILAVSLFVLSGIDGDDLAAALGAITLCIIELVGALALIMKVTQGAGTFKESFTGFINALTISKDIDIVIKLAVGVLILAGAMKLLGSLSWDEIGRGLTAVTVLLGELVGASLLLTNFSGKMTKGTDGIIKFSVALLILSKALTSLAKLSWDEIGRGLTAITALIGELIGASLLLTNFSGKAKGGSVGLVIMAAAITILGSAMTKLSKLSWDEIGRGLTATTLLFIELVGASILLSKFCSGGKLIAIGVGLILVSSALNIMSTALLKMADITVGGMIKSLVMLAGSLFILSYALNSMALAIPGAIALGVAALGLSLLVPMLKLLGKMKLSEVGKSLLALGGSLIILAAGLTAMIAAIPGAVALGIAAVGIALLVPSLVALGSMKLSTIGKSLLALAGAIAVLGIAGALLTPAIPGMLGLSAAILLIGLGALAAGVGISAFATGLSLLATIGAESIAAIVDGLTALLDALSNNLGSVFKFVKTFISGLLDVIVELVPKIVDVVLTVLDKLLSSLSQKLPSITNSVVKILKTILKGVRDNIEEFTEIGQEIVINFMNGISAKLPDIIQAGIDLTISFIDGMANGLENNKDRMSDAVIHLIQAMLDCSTTFLSKFITFGSNIVGSVKTGLSEKSAILTQHMSTSIQNMINTIRNAFSRFREAGAHVINGFINGVKSKIQAAKDTIEGMAKGVVKSAEKVFKIKSPSRVFKQIGMYLDMGLINGVNQYSNQVNNAINDLGNDAVDTMSNTIKDITAGFDTDADMSPTIRPIVDLSNVEAGASKISSLMGQEQRMSLMTNIGAISNSMNNRQNGTGNEDVVSEIKKLRSEMADLPRNNYNINGVTYDDGSNITTAVESIVRAARIERRI